MTVTQENSRPVILSSREQLLVDALQAAFASSFTIIDVGPESGRDSDGLTTEVMSEIADRVDARSKHIVSISTNDGVTVAELPGNQCLACVCCRQGRLIKTAAGIVDGMLAEDVLRVAAFAAQSAKERDSAAATEGQITAYAEQVTSCFEELVWLRELSLQIKQCDVSRNVGSVAEVVLPSLAELSHSETVALLSIDCDSPLPVAERRVNVAACAGKQRPLDEVLATIAARFGEQSCKTPVVVNRFAGEDEVFFRLGVRSLIVMPVQQQDNLYGWLVAVNREIEEFPEAHRHFNEELGLDEYGTIEAGLLQSACTLLATHAHNVSLFHEKEQLAIGTVKSLVRTLEARDAYTKGHSDRVAGVSVVLAKAVGYSAEQLKKLHLTGILHDIGKIGVPDAVLQKPGRLTEEEFEQIKQHPSIGFDILLPVTKRNARRKGTGHSKGRLRQSVGSGHRRRVLCQF